MVGRGPPYAKGKDGGARRGSPYARGRKGGPRAILSEGEEGSSERAWGAGGCSEYAGGGGVWYCAGMDIRALTLADVELLGEVDGTIESERYFHLERGGEGVALSWRVEDRPLRSKRVEANRLDDETQFMARQIASGAG